MEEEASGKAAPAADEEQVHMKAKTKATTSAQPKTATFSARTRAHLLDSARRTFARFDRSKDGKLNADELKDLLTNLCFSLGVPEPSTEQVARAMKQLDQNANGTIEQNEFEDWWIATYCARNVEEDMIKEDQDKKAGLNVPSEARALFLRFDTNQSGYLEFDEFASFIKSLTSSLGLDDPDEDTLKESLSCFDDAEDGRISYEEFNEWWIQTYDAL